MILIQTKLDKTFSGDWLCILQKTSINTDKPRDREVSRNNSHIVTFIKYAQPR